MSNRDKVKQPDGTVKKVYVSRDERRRRRNARREAVGAPLEIHVSGKRKDAAEAHAIAAPKSYNRITQLINPATGLPMTEPRPALKGEQATFLIDGVKYVWDSLGGAEGFARWARTHETKFRELSMKLIPAQVNIQAEALGQTTRIVHALPPPRYDPHKTKEQAIAEVDVDAVRQALLSLDEDQRNALMQQVMPPINRDPIEGA
jgi:hypothetical protein